MRKLVFLVISAVLFMGFATSHTSEERLAEKQRLELQVADSVHAKTFTINVNYVEPQNMMVAHYLTSDYSVRLQGDSVISYLPYFGRAYRADYNNTQQSPLTFSSCAQQVTIKRGKHKSYTVYFKVNNATEMFEYYVDIFPNGSASVNVSSSDRTPIGFSGSMNIKQ